MARPKKVLTEDEVLEREDRHEFEEKRSSDLEEIEVEFFNLEHQGLAQPFCMKEKGFEFKKTLLHGGKYKLPRKVIRWIESRQTPIYKWNLSGNGQMQKQLTGYTQRFSCKQVF